MEWSFFFRKLLLTMGFDGRWVNLIMVCASSVSYSFILNGGVCGSLILAGGLRQGDPLSPYFSILIADVFSKMIQRKVQEKHIHGAQASRSGPEISYLFFADDILLFIRASPKGCTIIVDILNNMKQHPGKKLTMKTRKSLSVEESSSHEEMN